jgi:hypothetical protein
MFKKCSRKIPELEEYLSEEPSGKQRPVHRKDRDGIRSVPFDNNDYVRRRGIVHAMPENALKVLNFDEGRGNAHAVIVIKNQYLPHGWGFFDANGVEGFRDSILVFRDGEYDVTDDFLTATPERAFNSAMFMGADRDLPEDYNPGFCGIFGIIFMVFYRKNKLDPDWVERWQEICECFLAPYRDEGEDPYKFALVVARETLMIVNENMPLADKENHIYDLVLRACHVSAPPRDDALPMGMGRSRKRRTRRHGIRKKAKKTKNTRDRRRSYRRGRKHRK